VTHKRRRVKLEINPVMANPTQAMKGAKGRNHPMGRLSERWPKAGWIIEEVMFDDKRMTPDVV
jgi:hypothetical protein